MGCSQSKDATTPDSDRPDTLRSTTMAQEAKSRLEWKMCQSKETPEPYFDISECALTRIPSGVFVLCKVLRKETLNLSHNQLDSMQSGGAISDLVLLQTLNLCYNRFSKLPDDLIELENLRELFIANNKLIALPNNINKLNNLQQLDVSNNRLSQINQINCMPNLRLLNLSGNVDIIELPFELSTCDSLAELIFDHQIVRHPPMHISAQSTAEVMKYLLTSERSDSSANRHSSSVTNEVDGANQSDEKGKSAINQGKQPVITDRKQQCSQMFIEQEIKSNEMLQRKLHEEQQKRKEEFLKQLMQQQGETDVMAQKLQEESDNKRTRLIENINKEEENVSNLVQYWLSSRRGPDPVLLEKERHEHEQLISQVHLESTDLRRQEIIMEMARMLQSEEIFVQDYTKKRDDTSRRVVEQESHTNIQLNEIFQSRGLGNSHALSKMFENEKLQKIALEALIARNDSRTWGLVEQVRIIEAQLATITQCEITRKQLTTEESLVDICEERSKLTEILLDLLAQQTARKKELLTSIKCVELQREDQQQDFWLLQYQKLIDSQPETLRFKLVNIDPLLGHQLLVNGVIHYIPLLATVFKQCNDTYSDIGEIDLTEAGVKNPADRAAILQAIDDFYHQYSKMPTEMMAANEPNTGESSTPATSVSNEVEESIRERENECVICMEKSSQTIFIPCGHLCCCIDCQAGLTQCPMCRSAIEQKIKVIPV